MFWFKHTSNASYDPKIVTIRKRWGREGVCRWWEILEIIAQDVGYSDRYFVSLPDVCWKDRLGFYQTKHFMDFLQSLSDVGLISFECKPNKEPMSGQCITILCPKLLEYRDNRFKNRGRKKTLEEDVEVDAERSKNYFSKYRKSKGIQNWEIEWFNIQAHARTKGSSSKMEKLSDKGKKALQSIGGMSVVSSANDFKTNELKKGFQIAFLQMENSEKLNASN